MKCTDVSFPTCCAHHGHRPPPIAARPAGSESEEVRDTVQVADKSALTDAARQKLAETGGATALGAALAGSSGLPVKSLPAILELARKHHPEKTTHVLYHRGCKDGFGAALAAWQVLRDKAEYIPVTYNTPPPKLPADARVAIVDFSFPREEMLKLKSEVEDVVVLDHHKSGQKRLEGLDFAVFDMERAGSGLSWHYFHPGEPLPDLTGHLEDYDLWRFQMDGTHEVNYALESYPMDFETWDGLSHNIDALKDEGRTVRRFIDRQVDRVLSSATRYGTLAGYRVPVANSPVDGNELAERMAQEYPDAPFVAVYYDKANGQRKWSLRGNGTVDVSEVAEQFPGGGGHPDAAGFQESEGRKIVVEPPSTPA